MQIREAGISDLKTIRQIHLQAFSKEEGPSIAALVSELLTESSMSEIFSLLAEAEGQAVGHIVFSPVWINDHSSWKGYILAPLGVVPESQKKGVGSALIKAGIKNLLQRNVHTLFVYGDPDYYGRFGFSTKGADPFNPPYELSYPFAWQGLNLNEYDLPSDNLRISCVGPLNDPTLW